MSTTLTLSLDELEVESFATEEWRESSPVRLAISDLATCTEYPNCNPTVKGCESGEYGPDCPSDDPNCGGGSNIWGCQTFRCV